MGKTALACKVLQDLERHRWPYTDHELPIDGIVYLSTRTAGISLERLFLDCAKLLGGEEQERLNVVWTNPQLETEKKIARLLEALRDGRYVILLDNLEDLLDDQGQLTDEDLRLFFEQALMSSQGAQLMVTSRVALAFRREVMRFDRQVKLLDGLPIGDGVELLRELDPNGDYGLRDAPEGQLAEAVELTHGVPRALEVLAGILANDSFATLDEVVETFYEQEDVVQALIEENYRRLDRDARRVIEALAVFRKPVPPLAVDYLLEPFAPGLDVPSVVQRLARTNIVSVDRAAKTVMLHPIDQDYAYSQLPEEDETEADYTRQALERRAADYYVQLRTPEETWESIDDLEPQLNEFEHRVRARDYNDACQVLEPIDENYLYRWGYYIRLIELRKKLVRRLTDLSLRMVNLGNLGRAYHRHLGQVGQAIDLYEQALSIARETDDRQGECIWFVSLGTAYYDLGQVERSIKFNEQSLAIAREIGDRHREMVALNNLGLAYRASGDINRAISLYEQALIIARAIEDHQGQSTALGSLGFAFRAQGWFEQAVVFYQKALTIAHDIGDRREEEVALGGLGRTYRALGKIMRAVECYEDALLIARETSDHLKESAQLVFLGIAYRDLGQIERSLRFYEEALAIARKINDRHRIGVCLGHLGLSYRVLGQSEQAIEFSEQALAVTRETGYRRHEVAWLNNLGNTYCSLGQIGKAIEIYEAALAIARETNYRLGESYQLLGLGRVLLFAGELSEARYCCVEAQNLDIPETNYQAKLVFGVVLLHQRDLMNGEAFTNVIALCQALLDNTPGLYAPRYALATALVGQAVCDPRWEDESQRPDLLAPALEKYRRALDITAAPGIVQDAIRDLELIQVAGIKGLEPAFELLENAEYKPDLPEDLPDILEHIKST
jgi:tetratricopeptide (TPR) repeat protein